MASSDNSVGTYTNEAKIAIKNMLGVTDPTVSDVQINGTSILDNGVANIIGATAQSFGVIKLGQGFKTDNSTGTTGIDWASADNIKVGTSQYKAINPYAQHRAVFYGLAKASGDTTQSVSDNPIGTYTDSAKSTIQNMLGISSGYVTKDSVNNAGISNRTYTSLWSGQFSVTTVDSNDWLNPHATASITGRISKHNVYRVTVNDTVYNLPCRLWHDGVNKVYEYIGNLGLYIGSTSGVPGKIDNVDFVIISDLDGNSSIDVLTSTTGTYTILVEQVNETLEQLPKSLIWYDEYSPIEIKNNYGTYNGFSIGVNTLNNSRGTFAIGYNNTVSAQFGIAIGTTNHATAQYALATGLNTTASGGVAHTEGEQTVASGGAAHAEGAATQASGFYSHSEGMQTIASGNCSHSEGYMSTASGEQAHAEGYSTTASGGPASHSEGAFSVASGKYSHTEGLRTIANHRSQHVFGERNIEDTSDAANTARGTYIEIVGNGTANDARSNARTLDWDGNEVLAGKLTVGIAPTNNMDVATKQYVDNAIPSVPVTDVQMNSTSIVSSGTATIPIADDQNKLGVVKVNNSYGITVGYTGLLSIFAALSADIKAGASNVRPITPGRLDEAVFYGLTKAAGVDMASFSNAVGIYTDQAKTAIKTMLGVPNDSYDLSEGELLPANASLIDYTTPGIYYADDSTAGTISTCPTDLRFKLIVEKINDRDVRQTVIDYMGRNFTTVINTVTHDVNMWNRVATNDDLSYLVSDVQINGTSIVDEYGWANIPLGGNNIYGVVKTGGNGVTVNSSGILTIVRAESNQIKAATSGTAPITPYIQHESVFYGLAKVAGDTTQASSSNTVGTYTDNAKSAIKSMLGVPNATYDLGKGIELPANADLNYYTTPGVYHADTSVVSTLLNAPPITPITSEFRLIVEQTNDDYVSQTCIGEFGGRYVRVVDNFGDALNWNKMIREEDYATNTTAGVVVVDPNYGLYMSSVDPKKIAVNFATSGSIKNGTNTSTVISAGRQHESTFYGLAKAAGDTTQSSSSNAVGTYTDNAKAAIQTMLGILTVSDVNTLITDALSEYGNGDTDSFGGSSL